MNDRIEKVLQGKCILYVTRAALDELGQLAGTVFEQARQLGLDECEIIENESLPQIGDVEQVSEHQLANSITKISASEAIFRLLATKPDPEKKKRGGGKLPTNNPKKFFLATQDTELADKIRTNVPNVPLLRISQSVLLLESPSLSSKKKAENEERSKQSAGTIMTTQEMEIVKDMKRQHRDTNMNAKAETAALTRAKHKAKAPNPLSCKKKKANTVQETDDMTLPIRKRKRSKKTSATEC